jgi:hypothetical protein
MVGDSRNAVTAIGDARVASLPLAALDFFLVEKGFEK